MAHLEAHRSLSGVVGGVQLFGPGIAIATATAAAAYFLAPLVATIYPVPAMVLALLIGISLNGLASRSLFEPGLTWCVKSLLRLAIGLLGLRVALDEIMDLGVSTALLVAVAMALTLASGVWLARLLKLDDGFGVLAGAATAVCGASAALATAAVVPNYRQKGADLTFTVIAANAVSTLVMMLYPALCVFLGFDSQTTGIMLGATIHDMAQVTGAAYAVSDHVGNTAVVVKLFRVLLLLPVVLSIGWWFTLSGKQHGSARVPVPLFAIMFVLLCLANSVLPGIPVVGEPFLNAKPFFVEASNCGLLVAIAALGLGTSVRTIFQIGWRHLAVFFGSTLCLLTIILIGLVLIGKGGV